MKVETLAVWAGIAASVAAVLAYFHARNQSLSQQMMQRQLLVIEGRLAALEGRKP